MKRKFSETSHEAHQSMLGAPIQNHHKQIIAAYKDLHQAIYEEIANHIGWSDKNKCSRRNSELERMNIIEKTGNKRPTSSGRMAFEYRLTPPQPKKEEIVFEAVQSRLF